MVVACNITKPVAENGDLDEAYHKELPACNLAQNAENKRVGEKFLMHSNCVGPAKKINFRRGRGINDLP